MDDILSVFANRPLADIHGLSYPMFALDYKSTLPFTYSHRLKNGTDVRVSVLPPMGKDGKPTARATIDDKDLLLFAVTLTAREMQKTGKRWEQPRDIVFQLSDFFKFCGLDPYQSPKKINLVKAALRRLKATLYETELMTTVKAVAAFSLLQHYSVEPLRHDGRVDFRVTLALDGWLHGAIVAAAPKMLLSISPRYFELPPFRKRVYELARKFCGRKDNWKINLKDFAKYTGSRKALRQIKAELLKIEAEQVAWQQSGRKTPPPLPDYWLNVIGKKQHYEVMVTRNRPYENAAAGAKRDRRKKAAAEEAVASDEASED